MKTEDKMKPMTELLEQTMKNYEQALKTGMKLQEESTKNWTRLFTQATTPQDLQKEVKAMAEHLIPQTERSVSDCLKLMEQSGKTNVELLKKAMAAAQCTSVQDAQAKFLAYWEASLNAMRDTAQSVTQSNAKAIESWMDVVSKTREAAPHSTKAA